MNRGDVLTACFRDIQSQRSIRMEFVITVILFDVMDYRCYMAIARYRSVRVRRKYKHDSLDKKYKHDSLDKKYKHER